MVERELVEDPTWPRRKGVPPQKDDGVDFVTRMKEIHAELLTRQKELNGLMKSIDGNLKELGL